MIDLGRPWIRTRRAPTPELFDKPASDLCARPFAVDLGRPAASCAIAAKLERDIGHIGDGLCA
ncbi:MULTISPECIES: hypothetical protein [Micrococcaceae]|uniref:hypothetical protein n=1 Tax=Micrococcaceae TaxID=1268 RepID=UPI001CE3D761|nr:MULTISPECIES: hypothetical protein [Micrococcaceae]MCX8456826.1 hypothetical protein [Paenarthrobacter ureafaciens]MCY0974434.1 hypothetical protein [Paenarthrobacter ureafaciens]UOD79594.1 hypothetical protein MQZ73_10485 [Paenarthrobacter ureafaciens]WNZ02948.1 hypothetical protein PVT25_15040 [Paenarthrobacter ureafaciens]WOC61443.1 hypothetical protein RI444_01920 [Paenarthrobacter sp. AT5]